MDAFVTAWQDAAHTRYVPGANDGHPIIHDSIEHTTGNSYQPFIRTWDPFTEAGYYRLCFRLKSMGPAQPYRCTEGQITLAGRAINFGPDQNSTDLKP